MSHRKVQCWIFSRDSACKIHCLLLKTNKTRGQFWQPVTGTVEPKEGYYEAACREPVEETGFSFPSAPVDTGFEFEFNGRFGHAREHVYAFVIDEMPTPRLDPQEHEDFQWVEPHNALVMLRYPTNAEGLKKSFLHLFKRELQ